MSIKRRQFVKTTSAASLAICGGLGGFVSGCTPVRYLNASVDDKGMSVEKSQWTEGEFVLIKNPKLPAPIYLSKQKDQIVALLLECTHKKCEVRPGTQILKCPCHGSEFTNTGEVLTGPADKDLRHFEVSEDQTHIYIR